MTPIEKLVPVIVKALRYRDSVGSWGLYDGWLARLVVGIVEERAKYRQADAWADLLEDELHEPEHRDHDQCYQDARAVDEISHKLALRDFNISQADYEWLKGKVGE